MNISCALNGILGHVGVDESGMHAVVSVEGKIATYRLGDPDTVVDGAQLTCDGEYFIVAITANAQTDLLTLRVHKQPGAIDLTLQHRQEISCVSIDMRQTSGSVAVNITQRNYLSNSFSKSTYVIYSGDLIAVTVGLDYVFDYDKNGYVLGMCDGVLTRTHTDSNGFTNINSLIPDIIEGYNIAGLRINDNDLVSIALSSPCPGGVWHSILIVNYVTGEVYDDSYIPSVHSEDTLAIPASSPNTFIYTNDYHVKEGRMDTFIGLNSWAYINLEKIGVIRENTGLAALEAKKRVVMQ